MKFEPKDREALHQIGVTSLLDLALKLPESFDDTSLSDIPKEGQVSVEIEVKNIHRQGGILYVLCWCNQWEQSVKIVIFNAKQWHFGAFKSGKKIFVSGKCSYIYATWQIINPKIITKINEIIPKYKTLIRDDRFKALVQKYVNLPNLLEIGLNKNEAELLTKIHKSDKNSVEILKQLHLGHGVEILKFIEIFNYLKKLSGKKTSFKAQKLHLFDISEWLENLPFKPTTDQLNAISDLRDDFSGNVAKRRVVMGDVGSGKTLVILAAALLIYPNPAIVMAPTSILAEQIFSEAVRLLPKFMNIQLVKSGKKNVDFSGANLIIGTHVLLYRQLPNSPLVMIDEQHRFGSNQREQINVMVSDVGIRAHVVQFSATPIPRTLSLIQSSFVEFSFLKQIPFTKHIYTQILQSQNFGELLAHIKAQITQQRQIAIIYPLVENSEISNYQSLNEASAFWQSNFKNVFVTHGRDKQKEQILRDFRESGDILLSTTVVEVGISLPRLTTIVIVGAERLGLATLHQLRGRVGRNGGEGWCFLFTKLKNPPERLKEFCQTLDGFKIAEIDLKNRQSGDILNGAFQHGATFEYYEFESEITQAAKDRLGL